ncbi:hypothetical protein [Nocardioides bruguierae]|uniref:Uncharacterized protein n=1 Tax=Nocardioides bruguierae TaxID=2945102 RepID=A0A9X2DAL8_9ACTN|nr:hypothetical protein [Nocardioides bruguierae]MCM0622190.1 hypothetical protein [Nocardioides bruguierae]
MRLTSPTITCDAIDPSGASCNALEVDVYACGGDIVQGFAIDEQHRAPGWGTSPAGGDLCPLHHLRQLVGPVDELPHPEEAHRG